MPEAIWFDLGAFKETLTKKQWRCENCPILITNFIKIAKGLRSRRYCTNIRDPHLAVVTISELAWVGLSYYKLQPQREGE